MVLDSVLSKTPVHKTELLHLLLKLERCNLCIETIMCPGSTEAAHFVPVAAVVSVFYTYEKPCPVVLTLLLWGAICF